MKLLTAFVFLSMSLMSYSQETIKFSHFPYVGTSRSVSEEIEAVLVERLITVCGSLENVARIANIKLVHRETQVVNGAINPNGIIGGIGENAILNFMYPAVNGSAVVYCKKG